MRSSSEMGTYSIFAKMPFLLCFIISVSANANPINSMRYDVNTGIYESKNDAYLNYNKSAQRRTSLEFKINIAKNSTGWYELFVDSAPWPTDLFIDDHLIGHLSFQGAAWPQGPKYKALNIFLKSGWHKIRFQRNYFTWLPRILSVKLKPSSNISGMVALTPDEKHMVFRAGERFAPHLTAQKLTSAYNVVFRIEDVVSKRVTASLSQIVPSGTGEFLTNIHLPTNKEGVFEVSVISPGYGQVSRGFQYVVIDTKSHNSPSRPLERKLVTRILPFKSEPDYTSPELVVRSEKGVGDYIESGSHGVYGKWGAPDYFAYTLKLPTIGGLYEAEIDYPDNEQRAFTISLVEKSVSPYAMDSGVVTGGHYPLSHSIKTARIYFYSREKNPRLLFLNWLQGKKIAISEIRIYSIDESTLAPSLSKKSERKFGSFYEEPMRFTSYFGAKPTGSQWTEIYITAKRWAEWSSFVGKNLWLQSIANYQHVMWPTDLIPGYSPSDEDSFSMLGPVSPYDMMKKDIVRLLLLMAEKYHISFIGELHIPAIGYIRDALDKKFTKNENQINGQLSKPWLIVSDAGKTGSNSPFQPYFNPLYPDVQNWIKSVVSELALRYKDSPSFDGIAIRLMSWAFASWQAFPSIHWGYGDFTINMFEHETGIKIPVSAYSPNRFKKRYNWLINNHYDEWVDWRVSKITVFYKELYTILKSTRPDLKLYIDAFGPDYSQSDWGKYGGWRGRFKKIKSIGWHKVIRETGVDPSLLRSIPGIIFSNSFQYPAGIRATFKTRGHDASELASLQWWLDHNPVPVELSGKPAGSGTLAAARFGNAYMEYNFPVRWIGYDHLLNRKSKTLRIAAAINPPGRLVLQKYAWALSVGNIDFITDGGLGYILGDPTILRPFLREYHSLPDIGMKRLVANKANSVWYGKKDSQYYIYAISTSDKKSLVPICFSKKGVITRLTTGENISRNMNNGVRLSLKPYGLIALKSTTVPIAGIACSSK